MMSTNVPCLNSRVAAVFFHGARPILTLSLGVLRLRARTVVGISQSSAYSSLVVKQHLQTSAFSQARPIISPSGTSLRTLLSPLSSNSVALVAPPADALRSLPLIGVFANTTAPPDSYFPTPLQLAGHPTSVSGPPEQVPVAPYTAGLSGKQRYSTAACTRVNHVAAKITAFEIILEPTGDPGSPPGDLSDTPCQVPRICDPTHRSRNAVKGYLKTVIHGQFSDKNSDNHATLIVADFQFLSSPDSGRFRKALIDFVPSPKGKCAIYPSGIAPKGYIALYPDDLWNGGLLWGEEFDSIHGLYDPDAVGWGVSECSVQESGIPPELTVAMLLRRGDDKPFTIKVNVEAAAGREGNGSFKADEIVPIRFDPKGEPIGFDALPPGTDINNLSQVNIANLCRIGPVDSRETLRARGYCQCGLRIL